MDLTINQYSLIYILWNLLLAVIPFFLFSLFLKEQKKRSSSVFKLLLLFFIWLLFLPNSAYIINEIRHWVSDCPLSIDKVCASEVWYLPFFFLYALLGYLIFFIQVCQARKLAEAQLGRTFTYIALPVLMLLVALGVLFGLVERFNSWEVFYRLPQILSAAVDYLLVPEKLYNWLLYALMLLLMYLGGEGFVYLVNKKR